jgi:hypothetical protein
MIKLAERFRSGERRKAKLNRCDAAAIEAGEAANERKGSDSYERESRDRQQLIHGIEETNKR